MKLITSFFLLLAGVFAAAQSSFQGEWMVSLFAGIGVVKFRAVVEPAKEGFRLRPIGTSLFRFDSGKAAQSEWEFDGVLPQGDAHLKATREGNSLKGTWRTKTGSASGLWSAEIAEPRKELTAQEREDEFVRLWRNIEETYIFFRERNLNSQNIIQKYLPAVRASKNDEEYFRTVKISLTELNDGHAGLLINPTQGFVGRLPFDVKLADGKVYVSEIKSTEDAGELAAGDEILAIDGRPIALALADAAKEKAFPVAATRMAQAAVALGRGQTGKTARITIRRGNKEVEVRRIEAGPFTAGQAEVPFKDLGDGAGYVKIGSFLMPDVLPNFDKAMEAAAGSKSIILDLRGNGGGNLLYAHRIAGRFFGKEASGSSIWMRNGEGVPTKNDAISFAVSKIAPSTKPFTGKVVVLADEQSFSATEIFLALMRENKRVTIFGRQTGGGAGAVALHSMKGEAMVIYAVMEVRGAKGTKVEGVGIKPDHVVPLTVEEALGKSDPTLEAARKWLVRKRTQLKKAA